LQQECPNSDTHEVAWYTLAINAVRARIFNQTNCDCLYYPSLRTPTTRTAILSLIISLSYLLERQYYKQLIPAIAIGLVAISAMTFTLTSGLEPGICCTTNVEPIAPVETCCAGDSKTTFLWLDF
jgi:hypothetical protein